MEEWKEREEDGEVGAERGAQEGQWSGKYRETSLSKRRIGYYRFDESEEVIVRYSSTSIVSQSQTQTPMSRCAVERGTRI